jgi:hypothetical protein
MLRERIILVVSVIMMAVIGAGCATRCEKQQTECHADCRRNYQLCQASGNDEFYCRNFIGNCTVQCDDAERTCHSWWP